MTQRKLATDKMAHLVSQCFGGAVVVDVAFPFLATRIPFDLRLWIQGHQVDKYFRKESFIGIVLLVKLLVLTSQQVQGKKIL